MKTVITLVVALFVGFAHAQPAGYSLPNPEGGYDYYAPGGRHLGYSLRNPEGGLDYYGNYPNRGRQSVYQGYQMGQDLRTILRAMRGRRNAQQTGQW